MEVILEIRGDNFVVARKIVQRNQGFFAYPGMKYLFSWLGGNLMADVAAVIHDEKADKFLVIFSYDESMDCMILGQSDWTIFYSKIREKKLKSIVDGSR
jgi:hypothetical protein